MYDLHVRICLGFEEGFVWDLRENEFYFFSDKIKFNFII